MKHFTSLFAFLTVLALAFAATAPAQVTTTLSFPNVTSRPLMTFHAAIDSVDTLTSSSFGLYEFDAGSLVDHPLSYGRLISSAGTPRVSVFLDGSFGLNTWVAADTLMTTDSVKTFGTGVIELYKKYPKYRLRILGTAGNRSDTELDLIIYASKRYY